MSFIRWLSIISLPSSWSLAEEAATLEETLTRMGWGMMGLNSSVRLDEKLTSAKGYQTETSCGVASSSVQGKPPGAE